MRFRWRAHPAEQTSPQSFPADRASEASPERKRQVYGHLKRHHDAVAERFLSLLKRERMRRKIWPASEPGRMCSATSRCSATQCESTPATTRCPRQGPAHKIKLCGVDPALESKEKPAEPCRGMMQSFEAVLRRWIGVLRDERQQEMNSGGVCKTRDYLSLEPTGSCAETRRLGPRSARVQ